MSVYPPVVINDSEAVQIATDDAVYKGGVFVGPVLFGNALYLAVRGTFSGTTRFAVYKSSDSGATWAALDSANGMTRQGVQGIDYDGAGIFYFAKATGLTSTTFTFQGFSLTTEVFSSTNTATIINSGGSWWTRALGIYNRSANGKDLLAFFSTRVTPSPAIHGIHWPVWDGASWSYDANSDGTAANQYPKVSLVDPNAVRHLFYYDYADDSCWYTQIAEDATNTAAVSVGTFVKLFNGFVVGSDLVFAARQYTGASTVGYPAIVTISPYSSASPTITVTQIAAVADQYQARECALVQDGGTLYFVFSAIKSPDDNWTATRIRLYYYKSTDGGVTWGPAVLIHDEEATPLFPGETDKFFFTLSAGADGSGNIGVITAVNRSASAAGMTSIYLTFTGVVSGCRYRAIF
jgi:hypothetical protein